MNTIYVKQGLKPSLKLSRSLPHHLSAKENAIRAARREALTRHVKKEAREALQNTTKGLARTLDPYHEEESSDLIQSLSTTKDAAGPVLKGYKTYKEISRQVKLNRNSPVPPSVKQGGMFRAVMKEKIAERLKQKAKNVPRKTAKQLVRTIDPYRDEEASPMVQSMSPIKDAAGRARKGYKLYKEMKTAVHRLRRPAAIKSGYRSRTIYGFRKIKGSGATSSASSISNLSKIRTLRIRFVPKNKIASLPIKTGMKRSVSSSMMRAAAQQVMRRIAAAAAANPNVWLIAAAAGVLFFLLMSVMNGLGGAVSSAGAFFMTDDKNAQQYKETVEELNRAFQNRIAAYQYRGYDDVRIEYMNEDGQLQVNWVEIFALVAVHFEQDLTFTTKQRRYIDALFAQFHQIDTDTQTYYVTVCEPTLDSETGEEKEECHLESRTRLIVKVYSYDMEDVFDKISFNEDQREWARRLVTSGAIHEQFPDLGRGYGGELSPGSLTPEEMAALLHNLGGDIEKARKAVIETAITLEGKVGYFWGGKSPVGWNDNWGKPMLVTAPGSDKTGTYQPYGLDCSGFIDWVFKTAGLGNVFSAGGTTYQWSKTVSVSMDEMIPGDLIFKNIPGQGGVNHAGIFIGQDQNGNYLYIHSQGGTGVIISSYKGFKYPRRPLLFQ